MTVVNIREKSKMTSERQKTDNKKLARARVDSLIKTWENVDRLYGEIVQKRGVKRIEYSILVDAYHVFRLVIPTLTTAFNVAKEMMREHSQGQLSDLNEMTPTNEEVVYFADHFLRHIQKLYESKVLDQAGKGTTISEFELKRMIEAVLGNKLAVGELPNANVMEFHRSLDIFCARFEKEQISNRIRKDLQYAFNTKSKETIATIESTLRMVERGELKIFNEVRSYEHYDLFIATLKSAGKANVQHGKYGYFVKDGRISRWDEKQVDTKITIRSLELAYETPDVTQIFVVGDTDFVPIFEKLERSGVDFVIVFIDGFGQRFPNDFVPYEKKGLVIRVNLEMFARDLLGSLRDDIQYAQEFGTLTKNLKLFETLNDIMWQNEYDQYAKQFHDDYEAYLEKNKQHFT